MDVVTIGIMILLLGTNAFWAWIAHTLINKLMSRNFYEYQQVRQIPKAMDQEKTETNSVKLPDKDSGELDALDELIHKIMPMG